VAASSMEMSGVAECRLWRGAGQRRRRLSVPPSGDEAQGAEGLRKKTMVWGKKEKFTPAALFIYGRVGVVGGWKCSTTPTVSAVNRHMAARSGAAVTVTVPLGHDGLQ
jgi:hypothetical protein